MNWKSGLVWAVLGGTLALGSCSESSSGSPTGGEPTAGEPGDGGEPSLGSGGTPGEGGAPADTGGRTPTGGTAPTGGNASTTGGAATGPIMCSNTVCNPLDLSALGYPVVAPCCAEGGDEPCGLDTDLLQELGVEQDVACAPLNQPEISGAAASCPSTMVMASEDFSVTLRGCCRAETNTCGYWATLTLPPIRLGCVDSGPFLAEGEMPAACGE